MTQAIRYIGINDHQIDLFEGQYRVPKGMSYNSYAIIDEKIAILDTVDKSSIFRTLTLFHAHRVVHGIDDGTGSFKYALCDADCDCELDGEHTHFHCVECNRTFCFKNIPTPLVSLPDGFKLHSVNYVVTGVCADCASKHHTNS